MSTYDRTMIAASLVLALAAVVANGRAALRPGPFVAWRSLRAAIAFVALLYVTGYGLLLAGVLSAREWTVVGRGIALAAWPLAWIMPPLLTEWQWARAERHAERKVDATLEQLPATHPR